MKHEPLVSERVPETDGFGTMNANQLAQATHAAMGAGQQIARDFGSLGHRDRFRLASAFRRQLTGEPGRKRSKEITAAYMDRVAGARGLTLYRNMSIDSTA